MINLRWAVAEEKEKIQTYLFEKMGKIPLERWGNILDCRWNETDDKYGVVVEEDGELAGFLGIVFADRMIAGAPHRTGNITSWFLEKHLRRGGLGQEMLTLITEPVGVTYIAISANFRSGALLKKINWQPLEDTRLYWNRTANILPSDLKLVSGVDGVAGKLKEGAAKIVRDHTGLNLTPHLLSTGTQDDLFFITYTKRKGDNDTAHVEILHSGNPVLLSKHIRDIANLLLPKQNSVLSSDKRFLLPNVSYDANESLQVPRYFKAKEKPPLEEIDFLYSEVVLLDLKIY